MENDWLEEELDLANYQLIFILNNEVPIYHKVQIMVSQGTKLLKCCKGYTGQISSVLNPSLAHTGSSKCEAHS